jgi:Putative Flp pilus-assembly TadE/G-like
MRDLILGTLRPLLKLTGPMRKLCCASSARLRHDHQDDTGAVGILIAILIGGGVLLGFGALVIDVGQIYAERAQLQSGADAGALAVAKGCASGLCASGAAQSYANANSAHGSAAVSLVCGSGSLGACASSTGGITDCPSPPPAGTNYVDVHTSTLMPNGSTLLPPVFARTLIGNQSYNGTTVRACAQAEWGAPSAMSGLGVTFSACEWDQATNSGTVFAQPPPYPPNALPSPSLDQVLKLHTTSGGSGCPTEPSGADAPGAFGWTADPAGNCLTGIVNGNYGAKPGNGVPQACRPVLSSAQANKTVMFMPIYVSVTGNGANTTYTLKGFAAFVITGYSLPGFSASDWLNPANNCKGSNKCINGYFTQALAPTSGGSIGGQNLGADIIKLTG